MPDPMAFKTSVTSVTGNDSRYNVDRSPIATRPPAGTESDFFRTRFLKEKNEGRLSADAAMALAEAAGDLDANATRAAQEAIQEAIGIVSGVDFTTLPWIGVSDEGVVTLQWQLGEEGVALFFAGGGTFALSTKSGPADHYTTDYGERRVVEGLPAAIRSKIVRLSLDGASTIAA
jgi:hypothetical protein